MSFIDEDFLLQSSYARHLYHNYMKDLPIIDYHCHLSAETIFHNRPFRTITELWLADDHYKWRALRAMGIDEYYITGEASDEEKFKAWASIVPKTVANPLHHWTHLELKRYFGIDQLLGPSNWEAVYQQCNEKLASKDFLPRALIERSNVYMIGTTDDPIDSLVFHEKLRADVTFKPQVLPTLRPDRLIDIQAQQFLEYLTTLEERFAIKVQQITHLFELLDRIVERFSEAGAKLADHGISVLRYHDYTPFDLDRIIKKRLNDETLTQVDVNKYQTGVLHYLAKQYTKKNWTMQLHVGALRNNHRKMLHQLGTDRGFDAIDDRPLAQPLNQHFSKLAENNALPQTIVYNLNPTQNEVVLTALGNFQSGPTMGRMQFGSGWWFNDQKRGMERQLNDLAHFGFLATFIGMLTDSRSFISYPRHEYFRRILANVIAEWVNEGIIPTDERLLKELVEAICFHNAKQYLQL